MKLIKRISVYRKTLILLTGFCVLMMSSPEQAHAQFPSASFTSTAFTGCAPLSVDFINLSSQATNYQWDFGNGNNSTLQDPTTVYLTPGYYTVTLVALDSVSGNTDTLVAINYIHVLNDPIADFTAPVLVGCSGNNSISFINLSQFSNNFIWDFGDGNFSTSVSPTHTYQSPGVYTVSLIAANPYGCNNIMIKNIYITIHPNPPASFTVNQQSSCDPAQVFDFTCTTPGALGWSWDFGDGATSNIENPSHVYGAPGAYTVSLIVFNGNGCSDTLINFAYISIGPSLVPSFTVNSQGGCIPFDVQFDCTVPNAISWFWDFGDGTTDTTDNPMHTYTASGSYDITLTVATSIGCNGTVSLPGYITVDPLPIPAFVVNTPDGCAPHITSITNNSAYGATYLWDFGNGTTSTDPNPTATYPDSGVYTITLTVTSPNGCQASITQTDVVYVEIITAMIAATPRTGCAPLTVNFTGSSTPPGATWNWIYGDGFTGSGQNPTHIYNAIGSYNVSMIVTSPLGCVDTITRNNFIRVVDDSTSYTVPDTIIVCTPPGSASFTDPTSGSNSWLWDFGDGATSTVKNPTHIYTTPGVYTVTLNTGMAGGCTQTINPYAYVRVIPFVTTPILSVIASPCAPYTVQLDNLSPDIVSYHWDFGDGDTSNLQNPIHVYAQPGIYTVSLLLTSIEGCQTTLSTTITFGYLNVIAVSDSLTCLGDPVTFTLNPPGAFVSASWDFGNGATSNQLQPVYIYPDTGAYMVSVTVTDTAGCIMSAVFANTVYVSDPLAIFSINQPDEGCVPYDVQFINSSTNASSYYWIFGDGNTSSLSDPLHTYTSPGVYTVRLNANHRGCRNSLILTDFITVYQAAADFSFTPDSGCIPLTVTFTDLSTDPVSWFWDFGDGTTDITANPVHTFNTLPGPNVSLVITDIHGCIDTASAPNVVGIYPDISLSATYACLYAPVNFSTTLAASSYLWDFGDGATSTQQNPSHAFNATGSYIISLTCVMPSGCSTTAVYPAPVVVDAPVANFTSPSSTVCPPSLVSFTNLSTGSSSWLWNFGDGSMPVSTDNASHIYNTPGSFTVTLIAISDSGCSDTLALVDYISVPGTITDFSISSLDACQNSVVQFTDLSQGASSWFWNFGDGFTDTIQNPLHIYADSGSFTVTLITYDSFGCTSYYSYPSPIVIHPQPFADATISPDAGCIPLTATFTNLSLDGTTYTWHFDDGTTSNTADTVHTYSVAGIYYPSLIANSSFGCPDTFVYLNGINASGAPVSAFAMSMASSCAPATVSFNNNSTVLLNPVYQWDFGNGQTSSQQNPVTVYNNPGTYQVTLIVTNLGGCADTLTQQIIIDGPVTAAAVTSGNNGCNPFPVLFTNNSVNATVFTWDFGDGNTSGAISPSHTYAASGNYTVTLIASNNGGCTDTLALPVVIQVGQSPLANFSRSPGAGCSPVNVTFTNTSSQLNNPVYSWDFGNGQTGNQAAPAMVYTSPGVYQVTLIVTNSNGCSDTVTKNVTVYQSPDANGSISSYNGCVPHNVNFTNNSQNATSYIWDFGDGDTSSQFSPGHIYSAAGTYQVMLIANGGNGCVDTMFFVNTINIGITPNVIISGSASAGCAPLGVSFTSQSTGTMNPSYLWNFGNGQTSVLKDDSVVYNTAGIYPVSLVIFNQGGCIDSASTVVNVNATPQVIATTADTSGCAPYTVTFVNTSVDATGYIWDFGDGNTSTQSAPVHTYSTPGTYTITLTATGAGGCSGQLILPATVHVKAMPDAAFTTSVVSGCTPLDVTFSNTSTGLVNPTWQWTFGNGVQSQQQNPTVTYTQEANFPVLLTVTNDEGCSDTASAIIDVNLTPVAIAGAIDTSGCLPYTISYNSNSLFADSLIWQFGNGTISNSVSGQFTYSQAGTFQPVLIALSDDGCADTLALNAITTHPDPVAGFTVNQSSGCSGSQFSLTNQSTPITGLTYQWNIAGVSSSAVNPVVTLTNPGYFNVSLIVSSAAGCSDTMVSPLAIQVFDTVPPPLSPILSVSVINNYSVEITWQNNPALDLGAYVLYRFNQATSVYQEIYRDTTPNNSSMNVTSTYIDNGLNTLNNVYTYKLQTIDVCAHTLPMAALTSHTTVNVSVQPVVNDIRVNWTRYLGCPVDSYQVHRLQHTTGALTIVATVPGSVLTYLDQGFLCPEDYTYRIKAISLCGSAYFSWSDTARTTSANPLANQKVEVIRSTVVNDKDILTEWMPPVLAPSRVAQYDILRSKDNIHFDLVASVPPSTYSYIDYYAYVHDEVYFYRVDVISDCMIAGANSNNGANILLRSDWKEEQTKLWWTPYSDWDTGVDYYIIEKYDRGVWLPIKTVDGNIVNTIVDE